MVTSGCVSIVYPSGVHCKEEIVLPPRQLTTTSADHIGSSLITNLETHLFDADLATWVSKIASRFGSLNLVTVADSATGNVKAVSLLFSHLQLLSKQFGITVTAFFNTCLLHQCARLLALHIEHQSMATSLYSITRLHQHATARTAVQKSMKLLLQRNFKWIRDRPPPSCLATSPRFRSQLFKLLSGLWTGEISAEEASQRKETLEEALTFFNGDILQSSEIQHFCHNGCHRTEQEALDHVTQPHSCQQISEKVKLYVTCGHVVFEEYRYRINQNRKWIDWFWFCVLYCLVQCQSSSHYHLRYTDRIRYTVPIW